MLSQNAPGTPWNPPRLVLDTNAWLDLLVFRDRGIAPLESALAAGNALVFIDQACLDELARVLAYPLGRFTLDAAGRDAAHAECRRISKLEAREGMPESAIKLPACRDPDDQKFLELALAVRADMLITKDRELLRLAHRTPFRILRPEKFE